MIDLTEEGSTRRRRKRGLDVELVRGGVGMGWFGFVVVVVVARVGLGKLGIGKWEVGIGERGLIESRL